MKDIKNNVPKLRFPRFSGEWNISKIKNIFDRYVDSVDIDPNKYYKEIGIRSHGKGIFHKPLKTGFDIGKKRVFWIKENMLILNIVFAWEQAISKTTIKEKGMIASHRFPMFKPKNGIAELDFFLYLFLTKKGKALLEMASPGGAGRNKTLGQQAFNDVKVKFPPLSEQQKIASFLTAVDKRITQLSRKKSLLEDYKKGIMQKLFSREIRFKDDNGNKFPEWEAKKLGDVCYKVSKKNKDSVNYPVYSINNIKGFVPQSEQFDGIENKSKDYDISLYKIVSCNTFAYNPARINVGSIGYSFNLEKVIISSLYVCFKTEASINDSWFNQYLKSFIFNKAVIRNTEGGVRQYLFFDNFSNIRTYIPSFQEQQKIADFLTAIDKKIDHVNTQLEKTKEFKKGLLQQMFV